MHATNPEVSREKMVGAMARSFAEGKAKPLNEDGFYVESSRGRLRSFGDITWGEFDAMQQEAIKVSRRLALEAIKAQKDATIQTAAKRLVDRDTSLTVPANHLERFEAALREVMTDNDLEVFNKALRERSGGLTWAEIALVGCVHRMSVTGNGKHGENFKGTSPFKRMALASVSVLKRESPLDNRQIRYALDILSAMNFTTEVDAAVHTYDADRKAGNKAGVWIINPNPFWDAVFDA
jgi:hypothetical protein